MKEAIFAEIRECLSGISDGQISQFVSEIKSARHIFIHGKGRMGLVLKTFAADLAELGYFVRIVGDVTVPPIGRGDLLIVTPTGGDPKSSTRFLEVARENGARVAAFTAFRAGKIGGLADVFLEARARTMNPGQGEVASAQPMCTVLEQAGLLIFGCMAAMLAAKGGLTPAAAKALVLGELARSFGSVEEEALHELIRLVQESPRVFFGGAKKEFLILSCYAMRVFHMGKEAYVCTEATSPELAAGDTLVVSCGDGGSPEALLQMRLAKKSGARVLVLTSRPRASGVREYGDFVFCLPGLEETFRTAQLAGAAYCQGMLVTLDDAVCLTMEQNHWKETDLSARHTNLE